MPADPDYARYLDRSTELLWRTRESRGARPQLSVDAVVDAAITLADRDGVEALSMRGVARELGVGAMTLYRYVPGKAELLDLMLDRVTVPSEEIRQAEGKDWRGALEVVAHTARALYLRHPWLLQVNWARPVFGPNTLASFEHLMAKIRPSGLTSRQRVTVAGAIDGYITGMVRQEIRYQQAEADTGVSHEAFWAHQGPVLEQVVATGDYPTIAALADDAFEAGFEEIFEFGLQRLLDGLSLFVERHHQSAHGQPAHG